MTGVWTAVIGAAPAILTAILGIVGHSALSRRVQRIEKHVKLLGDEKLPAEARGSIEKLVNIESNAYAAAILRRDGRKVDGSSIAALLMVTVVGALAGWGVVELVIYSYRTWWMLASVPLAVVVLGFTLGLALVGTFQIWDYGDVGDGD